MIAIYIKIAIDFATANSPLFTIVPREKDEISIVQLANSFKKISSSYIEIDLGR